MVFSYERKNLLAEKNVLASKSCRNSQRNSKWLTNFITKFKVDIKKKRKKKDTFI